MTCKDCKSEASCTNKHKSYEYSSDSDSWANWCDDFQSVYEDKSVTVEGYTITQSGENHHIMITDCKGNFLHHAACTEDLTEEELLKEYGMYLELRHIHETVL